MSRVVQDMKGTFELSLLFPYCSVCCVQTFPYGHIQSAQAQWDAYTMAPIYSGKLSLKGNFIKMAVTNTGETHRFLSWSSCLLTRYSKKIKKFINVTWSLSSNARRKKISTNLFLNLGRTFADNKFLPLRFGLWNRDKKKCHVRGRNI